MVRKVSLHLLKNQNVVKSVLSGFKLMTPRFLDYELTSSPLGQEENCLTPQFITVFLNYHAADPFSFPDDGIHTKDDVDALG